MGSRRATTTRSSSWNGRSSNGDDSSGSSRPGGCSYLSNVRPENRSTLCSVMAQLTEETQPSFEITLKSKAVSENCNVKFSCVVTGYPIPQVMWYKDDMQLDRYCGLPKYEIFRNGQNHSLHIYNCTVEDAAIYQASAINSKGIVSCSGVLEVGEMNEFKIHQRYFAKLKQKAEHKRREAEGKENQEPLRTISPDRSQRKRRSTMEAFLSTPSSMEDEGSEENHQAVALETEARLQEATVEKAEEKPVPVTNGAVSAVTNGQVLSETGTKGILKEDIIKTEDTTAMDIDEKSDTSTSGSLAHRDLKSVDTMYETRTALPQCPCKEAGDQLSEKETSPCQKSESESRPALLSEVTQAHTKMNRNGAPVNLEPPPNQCTMDAQPPQRTPSESETTADDIQTLSLHCGLQAAIDNMTQDTWDHSRGSNESHTVLFTDLQKSALENPGGELASGARRKILIPKAKPEEATEATSPTDNQAQKKEVSSPSSRLSTSPVTPSMSPSLPRRSPLLQPAGERTSPVERHSPLLSRRKTALETQVPNQQVAEEKHDPFKAPQVIRKIRGETFADASGHLKLWCQFFNVLSDSTIKWFKNEEEITQIKRNAGDETQVNLAIVQASCKDSGVYGCSITNEYGTDSTDTLLSADILAGMSLREDLGVGEEIEMTPLIFSKGVADSGIWGNKLFGRIMMQESHIGGGCSHKVWRAKVIYGLEPVFESGNTCIIKVRNPIAYGGKGETCLVERNLDIIKQECKIQNLAREYCKIFSAEARVIENFGPCLEVVPVYLMYRPANIVPYATVEADLTGDYQQYSVLDYTGRMHTRTGSGVEQKCCALQHWIFQWTNGNLLLTRLEGVDTKITSVGISVKSTGHQGLSVEGNPKVFEQFVSQHQCNYFCGLLGLRSLKVMDSLLTPAKPKGSRSPLLQRKMTAGSSSPQTGRKAASSPRMPRKAEQEGRKTPTKQKAADAVKMA
ncbi:alpha-protein kinase 3 [Lates japonicus]|uniref:non-specific serine/threonine protein kinase n=1 Tax=Lates japonicus TaxID=270547 RepID=A0AAD3R7Y8_LATJO|nr:alpha-protein kinase 3 [Lates japonicus]